MKILHLHVSEDFEENRTASQSATRCLPRPCLRRCAREKPPDDAPVNKALTFLKLGDALETDGQLDQPDRAAKSYNGSAFGRQTTADDTHGQRMHHAMSIGLSIQRGVWDSGVQGPAWQDGNIGVNQNQRRRSFMTIVQYPPGGRGTSRSKLGKFCHQAKLVRPWDARLCVKSSADVIPG